MPRTYDPAGQARRYEAAEKALKAEGGQRLMLRLSGEASKRLAKIMKREGFDTKKQAIEYALMVVS